jgi:hypothetical protein
MVLTKDELISALKHEVHILLHLASKVEPAKLDYRPTPKQRTLLELLQYLTIVGPIHLRATLAPSFDRNAFGKDWNTEEPAAAARDLEATKTTIGKLSAYFAEQLGPCSDADLRAEIEMFGRKASRGSMIVNLVLSHYTAYRMQLFLYLKSCGHEELNTLNLWVGMDAPMKTN